MKRKSFTLEQKAEVIARNSLGQTARFISSETGIGWESVRTIIKRFKNDKPSRDEIAAIEAAKSSIRSALEGDISNIVDSSLRELLSTQQRIREYGEKLLDVMNRHKPIDSEEAALQARSLAAISTSIKSGADFARVLRKEITSGDSGIEEFTIQDLTDEDIAHLTTEALIQERMMGVKETSEKI